MLDNRSFSPESFSSDSWYFGDAPGAIHPSWGVVWGGSWGNAWGPLHEVYDLPITISALEGSCGGAYSYKRKKRIQREQEREEEEMEEIMMMIQSFLHVQSQSSIRY